MRKEALKRSAKGTISTGCACRIMEIFYSRSGPQRLSQCLYSVSSMTGTEENTDARKMNLGVLPHVSKPILMGHQGSNITQNTRFKFKVQMVSIWIEIPLGHPTKYRTKTLSFTTVFSGTPHKNSNGRTKNLSLSQSRV